MSEFDLSGQVAIVTGGNGGIGRGIALGFARAGAHVVIAARNEEKSAAVAGEIEAAGVRCERMLCDVNRLEDIEATICATYERFGGLNILVNNAGIARGAPPEHSSDDDWDLVLDTNLRSAFRFCRAAHPLMKAAGGGKIINIASEYSLFGSPRVVSYSASKGGVIQLTRSLAIAWAPDNIQVNAILPGWIRTDMTQGAINNRTFYDRIIDRTPASRFGEPEELAGAAVFLASRAAGFITGQTLAVDGGFSIA